MSSKADVRQMIRERLALMPPGMAARSAEICEAIVREAAWASARTVALFAPTAAEPDVELLWAHAAERRFCFPRMRDRELDLVQVADRAELVVSRWNVREPLGELAVIVDPGEIDVMLVPGLGFTHEGHRLGRGGGYYDRLLAHPRLRAVKIGVCFAEQLVDMLPTEAHDARVDRVISA